MADRADESADERAAAAFRAALTSDAALGDVAPDLVRERGDTRRRRRGVAVLAGAIVVALVVAGSLAVPRLLPTPTDQIAAPATPSAPSPDPAPDGWRTEYYRDISFQVPADWGYEFEPGPDWCVESRDGTPAARYRRPYVSLGRPAAVRDILCPTQPDSLLTEHVIVFPQPAAVDYADGTVRRGKWWIWTKVLSSVVFQVTSADRERATRIADSATLAEPDAPCPPSSPVQSDLGADPPQTSDLAALESVEHAIVCQYDPDRPDSGEIAGLRAVRRVDGRAAASLTSVLAAAPPHDGTCRPPVQSPEPDVALLVVLWAEDGGHDIYVQASGCPSGRGSVGGIADGTTLRALTRAACQALVRPPIAVQTAGGDVARNCTG